MNKVKASTKMPSDIRKRKSSKGKPGGGLISLIYRPRNKEGKPLCCENKYCAKRLQGQYKILGRQNGPEFHVCLRCFFLMMGKSKGHLEKYVPMNYKTKVVEKPKVKTELQKELESDEVIKL